MHQYEVVGFRPYSGEYEGRKYSGYFVHCLCSPKNDNFTGKMVKELKIKSKLGYTPAVGDIILVSYDEYGICEIKAFD